ncbi:mitochondrial nicotinamide adenine dinucleotide transporter SLC25A51-like isoform X1 [Homarus americanus]|uniref:mitochondrial nicotinamide adenine dinucleotide transporter SLC25A51-like isoform X1 n=1 Tax=Homarus americanus TaxID=6706 RepID=UPI001C43EF61|nr:mitochondrial nicotinamide adenine dinucleotide transporter SLC25A51-like isoform X1 [Homarus americanus]
MGLSVVEQDHSSGLPPSLGAVLPKQSADKPAFTMPDPASTSQALARVTPLADDGREFVCGWGAAFINITVTFPMNKLMFRQMLHGISTASAVKQLKREGLKNLYRGILPPLCQKTISTSIMFGMFDQYGKLLKYYQPQLSDGATLALAATLAGCTEAILCPFERIQTLLQDKKFHGKYKNSIHTTREMWKFGVKEYYRGMVSILLRNGPSNILFFGLRTEVKTRLPDPGRSWWGHILSDFVSGAFLGAFISTVMYPINVIKAHQQTQVGGPFQTMRQTFWDVYQARGRQFIRLFSGAHVNYTRALVSWGIINASYEILLKLLYS